MEALDRDKNREGALGATPLSFLKNIWGTLSQWELNYN